jgi:pyruvate,orthophosphate dikinase
LNKLVYDFAEGRRDMADLLGGKGANLSEMSNLGLPVPPGFTITTEACRVYLTTGAEPDGLWMEVDEHLERLQRASDKMLGDPIDPLLVSVRSGAPVSMPGMMETVLNVGLNDMSVMGLASASLDERFAWDSYRRLIQMFGKTVLGISAENFDDAYDAVHGSAPPTELRPAQLRAVVEVYKSVVRERTGREFPQDPREQLTLAVRAVFSSWNAPRAVTYRRQERLRSDSGTAVSVVAMVFGNMGPDSGTGVAFTRDPATGERGIYGDYLPNAQGEDVVAGIRNTLPLAALEQLDKRSYDQLLDIMSRLERHYRDLCDIEFTIEHSRLWILQTRVGKRTAAAAFIVATQFLDEGLIDLDEALRRVSGEQLSQLMFPRFVPDPGRRPLSVGMNASPGAATGAVVFDSPTAIARARAGQRVILVRRETNADDLDGMIAAVGVLTSRGGRTSHAAVVARGMGRCCVCGADELEVDVFRRLLTAPGGVAVGEGDVISIDGSTGEVFLGEVPVVASPVVEYFEGCRDPDDDDLVRAVHRLMSHSDSVRRLRVRVNADTGDDSARARRFGAQGVGLCRTEHMFLGERRVQIERLVLAETETQRTDALDELLPLQRADFAELFAAMDGLPVTIRLLDPPLHEFLPDLTDLSVRVALAQERGNPDPAEVRLLDEVRRRSEQNPMLGLRGVRLGLLIPGLVRMQVRAIAQAATDQRGRGVQVHPEIMVPLVGTAQELHTMRDEVEAVLATEAPDLHVPIGTMIELPRAALTAGQIAAHADFFSFGTNDLTQTTWGFSRDDVEASFFTTYLERGIFGVSPFESIDPDGVGRLVRIAVVEGRGSRPGIKLGVCGEHGGDPASVRFFHDSGLDYVSCSVFRVPIARLEAGRATVLEGPVASSDRPT